ncbi:MAG: cob(I)yrinic acid a,c-diamide adenosyltransferase [Candidatus Omnitrophica bacterium]|nr:cob(I)yrinic acid a,c-diamide adenosyltransferase [Candidatus Omnitrophota bacterium]
MGIRSGKGDKGYTDLFFRHRISKDSHDIRVIGDLDELNCNIGLVRSKIRKREHKAVLEKIQKALLLIGSEIAVGAEKKEKLGPLLKGEEVRWIRKALDELEREANPGKCFVIPGETELSAYLDMARAVARRAERSVVGLFRKEKASDEYVVSYLNCISDVLFVMARCYDKGVKRPGKKKVSGRSRKAGRK